MKGIKECTGWLIDNYEEELKGQRSNCLVRYSNGRFIINYDNSEEEVLDLMSVFEAEDWQPVKQKYVSWAFARDWMEKNEGVNKAIKNNEAYVVLNGQLRKIDDFSGDSYTISFFKVELTDSEWVIDY